MSDTNGDNIFFLYRNDIIIFTNYVIRCFEKFYYTQHS
jgi:hypothetical protein